MALALNALEPVDFGGTKCTPEITTETKMRLSQIKTYDASALETLASAFPKDEEYVKKFLEKMTAFDIEVLHAYLIGGDRIVESVIKRIDSALGEASEGIK